MAATCRVCLAESSQFKSFNDKEDLIEASYLAMVTALVSDISVQKEDILCSICCADLVISYNFVTRIRSNQKAFLAESCECKLENVKDPLEEDSCDEQLTKADFCDDELNVPMFEETNEISYDQLKETPTLHNLNFDERSFSSDKCDDEFLLNNLSDLNISPENVIFPKGRFKCHICGILYFTAAGLKAHHEVHLPKIPATKKKRLRRHNKQKTSYKTSDIEPIASNHNDSVELSNDLVDTIQNSALEPTGEGFSKSKPQKEKNVKPKKKFPCHVCGKEMISASKLRYHLVMHTGEKDFLCSMCPKAYSTIYALKHHFRTHSGYRPYECKFCGDRFYRPTTLKSHVRRHTGERPYGCEICGKKFIQHSSMTTHIKLNHMSKTIPCPHCDKKYARQTDLNTHLLSHTGDKPFSCQLCPSRFVRQANLNKHIKQQHCGNSTETKKKSENNEVNVN